MRITRTCPKCASRKLFVIGTVKQTEVGSQTPYPVPVTTEYLKVAWWDAQFIVAGHFEAWVCAGCGYTEWYAKNANEGLARLAQHPEAGVVFLDGDSPLGPYR